MKTNAAQNKFLKYPYLDVSWNAALNVELGGKILHSSR